MKKKQSKHNNITQRGIFRFFSIKNWVLGEFLDFLTPILFFIALILMAPLIIALMWFFGLFVDDTISIMGLIGAFSGISGFIIVWIWKKSFLYALVTGAIGSMLAMVGSIFLAGFMGN